MNILSRPKGLHYNSGLLVALFVSAISLPLAANLAGRDGADSGVENRQFAPLPRFDGSWPSAVGFGGQLRDWFSDHFGFRSTLVRWYGESRLFGLGVSPTTAVVKGKDGWFFYGDDEALSDYANTRLLTPQEVERWRDAAVAARDWLKTQGIGYVVMIAPDKHVIYPEGMPSGVKPLGTVSRTDQVTAALRDAGVATIDVRPALFAAKSRERLYQQTDTHWNDRGALIAYQALIEAVRSQLPAAPAPGVRGGSDPPLTPFNPLTREDFEAVSVEREGLDLAGMMGLTHVMRETDLQLRPKRPRQAVVIQPRGVPLDYETGRIVATIPGSPLPHAVVFRDSFFSRLAPFVAEHFGRTVFVWQNDFDPDVVLEERPAIVIQEIVGRHLYTFLPTPELVPR